ncbi:sugar ABC transporter ATP-binding protein [Rhodococcus sp. NPDC055024]
MTRTVARLTSLTKSYAGVQALASVDLSVDAGEVRALLGPNGSGKSTLIGMLGGAVVPDSGQITVAGKTVSSLTPTQARELGIAVIYQHFSLADSLSVSDNIFLGAELKRGIRIDKKGQRARTMDLIEAFDLNVDPDAIVGQLSAGQRQVVEIAKALLHAPSLLILDEPTAALSIAETEQLLQRVEALAKTGLGIIFISHLLDDVLRVANSVTILRDGVLVCEGSIAEFDRAALVAEIAPSHSSAEVEPAPCTTPLLQLDDAIVGGVGPLHLTLHEGEVLGLFGLLGAGRTEFLEGLFGLGPTTGRITLGGNRYHPISPRAAIKAGLGLVTSDRTNKGLFSHLSARDNVLISVVHKAARRHFVRRKGLESKIFDECTIRMSLYPPLADLSAAGFSGGNQQKLMLGRWLNGLSQTRVLLLDEPTQGVDIGARSEIYREIRRFAQQTGHAVLVAASETEELAELADRVLVLHRGSPVGIVERTVDFESELLSLAHMGESLPTSSS